jgi:hypothetical protein
MKNDLNVKTFINSMECKRIEPLRIKCNEIFVYNYKRSKPYTNNNNSECANIEQDNARLNDSLGPQLN